MSIMKRTFRNKLFLCGFSVMAGLLLTSLLYFLIFNDRIPIAPLLYDSSGKPIKGPYSGKLYPPLGVDNFGRNIALVMLIGVKYTIFAATVITILRVIPSILFGFIIHFYLKKIEKPIKYIADSINYFPTTLLVFLLLGWLSREKISFEETSLSFWGLILFYIFIFSVVSIPSVSVLIANEIGLINKMEFIQCSRTLGASSSHIIKKHIRPFLVPQLFIIFIREFIQTLLLMSHMGILGIYITGYEVKRDLFDNPNLLSKSNEWAGALGMWWHFLWTMYPWIAFIPVVLIATLILASKCILDGLQNVLSTDVRILKVVENESNEEFKNLRPFQLLKTKLN
ncbi:peptide ABC transporter permease [Psychrobacillus sp. NPDC058041]|uniref:peptide ABC transporter permease n=1 Tax=Psychrobacillus sp. NPDC058041 TaxID=3346310 RepID=UPI0036DAF228